jgi:hypothetical protein
LRIAIYSDGVFRPPPALGSLSSRGNDSAATSCLVSGSESVLFAKFEAAAFAHLGILETWHFLGQCLQIRGSPGGGRESLGLFPRQNLNRFAELVRVESMNWIMSHVNHTAIDETQISDQSVKDRGHVLGNRRIVTQLNVQQTGEVPPLGTIRSDDV